MRLHLRKKRGFTQVNAGRVVRVKTPHGVPTSTWFGEIAKEDGAERWPSGQPDYVAADVGDLAIVMCDGSTPSGDVVGYSYLSGDAIQLNSYDADPEWFAPAEVTRFYIPRPKPGPDVWMPIATKLLEVKYGGADLAVFRYRCTQSEPPQNVAAGLMHLYRESEDAHLYRMDGDPADRRPLDELRTHVLGEVASRSESSVNLNFQPASEISPFCATPFQIEMALRGFR